MILAAAGIMAVAAGFVWWRVTRTPAPIVTETNTPLRDTFIPTQPQPETRAGTMQPTVISMAGNESAKPSLDELIAGAARKPQNNTDLADPLATPLPVKPSDPAGGGVQPAQLEPAPRTPAVNPGPAPVATAGNEARTALSSAESLMKQNKLVEARTVLNTALMNAAIGTGDRGPIRAQLATINDTLFFSPTLAPGDTICDTHEVKSGETLARIVRRQGLPIDWRLLVRINKMPSENSLKVGQKLKIVRLPLHAVVHKSAYRMDIYAGPPATGSASVGPDGQEPGWTYIRSFRVGLGESNGTPEGTFAVKTNSKLINPKWVNPRTGEVFEADNAKNPIGEHWIGLEGTDPNTKSFTGYGIHGTVDPDSIGQQKSMGCVRMNADDVAMVYEMLIDKLSTVKIIK